MKETWRIRPITLLIHYRHYDCAVDPAIAWDDTWSSAVNGPCPACGIKEIVPVAWHGRTETCRYCDPEDGPEASSRH